MADLSALLNAIATEAQARAGTDNTQLMTPLRTAQAIGSLSIFTKEYVSAEQVITAGGLLTIAHGLGAEPKDVKFFLVCKTAELGYSVGDKLPWGDNQVTGSTARDGGLQSKVDATNIYVRYGSSQSLLMNWSTGSYATFTNAYWRLIVKAWA